MTQPDEIFDDYAFASIYDDFNGWGPGDDFYLAKAREIGGRVLDLGCGTGMLACRIAAEGLDVVGADPADGMLRVAHSRPGAERVRWVHSDGQSLRLPDRFDFIYMTGHAFQALLTDEIALGVLKTMAHHLSGNGSVAFDTRNPLRREWQLWTPENACVAETRHHGRVEESHETMEEPGIGIVAITHRYRFLDRGTEMVGHSRIRFIGRDHLDGLLGQAGLKPTAWYGDWDGSPLSPASKEIIPIAKRV
jgi:SAM-dependent methyltransferase